MIQSVLIISSSGLVIFSKHFSTYGIERMFGALLRTIIELATATTGGALTYVETAATEPKKAVAIEFGRILSQKILSSFVDEYSAELTTATFGHILGHFKAFGYRIPALVRDTLKSVLQQFALVDGLDAASIVGDDGLTESFVGYSARHEVDEVAMLSTVRPLLAACADLMSSVGDGVREISIKSDQAFRVLVWRLEGASLVLHVQDKVGESQIMAQAGTSFSVLERICRVIHRIRRIGSGGPAGTFTLADDLDALSGNSM